MTKKLVERGIFELLKSLASGRVYIMRAPQNSVAPFVIFQRVDSERWRNISGPDGIAKANIQVDCYAASVYAAKELGAEVETILDGYKGTVYYGSSSPQPHVKILGVVLENDLDILDETDEPALMRNTASYLVTYNQED